MQFELTAAHLNHGLRGEDAETDALFARAFAESLDVRCVVARRDLRDAARRLHLSEEEAARRARHGFLDQAAIDAGADRIALGHTRDDRIETILLNILRGTGSQGLKGLAPISGPRIRPLLNISRMETADYCRERGIAYRDDLSNLSLAYTRNRVRQELLPELASYYNTGIGDALLRLSDIVAEESAYMDEAARSVFETAVLNDAGDSISLAACIVSDAHPAIARRLVRLAIERVRGGLTDIEYNAVERVMHGLRHASDTGVRFQFALPDGNIYIGGDADHLFVRRRVAVSAIPFQRQLAIPGETLVPELGLSVRATPGRVPDNVVFEKGSMRAFLDAGALNLPLSVRTRKPGDRFRPLGMSGSRKLQDYLTDRKTPVESRDRVPLIVDSGGIVWIPGHTISDRVKIRADTDHAVFLEIDNV